MLDDIARKGSATLARGSDAALEAAHTTVMHLQRMAGAISGAAGRLRREAGDLVWDYQDVAADLRRPAASDRDLPAIAPIDLHRRVPDSSAPRR